MLKILQNRNYLLQKYNKNAKKLQFSCVFKEVRG